MKIFISSARKGLMEERDALEGLIRAVGHTPVRFEDFSAQTTPSREVCLKALETADVCLFLLGPNYGHEFPETGQSATHDEWVAARASGKPSLVYRKLDVIFEPRQQEFARQVEAYATGQFRDNYRTTTELQTKIARKILELASAPSPLAFARLTQPPTLQWTLDAGTDGLQTGEGTLLEVHVLPLDSDGYSLRELDALGDSLVERVRMTRMIQNDIPLSLRRTPDQRSLSLPVEPRAWNTPRPGRLAEIRLYKSGQISTRATLPQDGMGPILDTDVMPRQIAELLKLKGALGIVTQGRIVVAAGVSDPSKASVDNFDPKRSRNSASFPTLGKVFTLRTEPDESVTLAALHAGAEEVAQQLARALMGSHPSAS
jgi:hypothetical protein